MILSHQSIRRGLRDGTIGIDPSPSEIQFQPCTVDLRLASDILVFYDSSSSPYCLDAGPYRIRRDVFVLAATVERVKVPADLRVEVSGRSSLARLGIVVHQTGGFVDPGWDGVITLEITCVHPAGAELKAGMRICQIEFSRLDEPTDRPYGSAGLGSKYQFSTKLEPSRLEQPEGGTYGPLSAEMFQRSKNPPPEQ